MINRIISIFLTLILFAGTLSFAANTDTFAAASGTGTYVISTKSGDMLNFRSEASTSGKLLSSIPNGTTINVTKVSGSWGYISYGGKSGWVCLDYCNKKTTTTTKTTTKPTNKTTTTTKKSSSSGSVVVSSTYANVNSYNDIYRRLNELRVKFPNGKYWNKMGKAKADLDSYTSTPCPSYGTHHASTANCIGQCDGFARKLGLDLFGKSTYNWNKVSYSLDTVCVGDLIRYNSKHTIMVVGFTSNRNELIIADCNWNCNCNIRWDASFKTSYLRTVNWVLRYPGNTLNRSAYLNHLPAPATTVKPSTTTAVKTTTTTTKATTTTVPARSVITTTATKATTTTTAAQPSAPLAVEGYEITRLGAADRISTAVLIASTGWKNGSENVILANAYSFADAQAGATLANALNAPILLTAGKNLENNVLGKIKDLKAKNVYILGGTSVVSSGIENLLKDKGLDYNVIRIAGNDRFETSVRIAEQLGKMYGGSPSTVFFVNGYSCPDIMAVSSAAAATHSPILYVPENGDPESSVSAFMAGCSSGVNAVIIGEFGSASEAVERSIISEGARSVKRIAGKDRYETSVLICADYADKFSKGGIFITTGKDYPDSLAGGAYAATMGYPVILAGGSSAPAKLGDLYKKLSIKSIYILGGTSAVPDDTAKAFIK